MAQRKRAGKLRRDKPLSDDEVIATRAYNLANDPDHEVVLVRLGRPRRRESDGLFECGAEINESGRIWVRRLLGADCQVSPILQWHRFSKTKRTQ